MKALILAGGEGTRLRPITYEMPKPMIPVNGKPLLQHIIEKVRDAGLDEIVLCIGYMGHVIENYFGDGSKFGTKITYVKEDEPMGTAGPLKLAKKHLDSTFLYLNGDIMSTADIKDLIKTHLSLGGKATMALFEVEDPSRFGVAAMDGSRIVKFIEKPKKEEAPTRLINAGMIVLEPDVIDLMEKDKGQIEVLIYPKLLEKGQLNGWVFSGMWYDLGTWESYGAALKEIRGIKK